MDALNIIDTLAERQTNLQAYGLADNVTATVADVNYAIAGLNTLIAEVTPAALVPVVRTNNPLLAANDVNSNLEALDAAIGTDAQLTVLTRTVGPLVVDTTVMQKFDAVDLAIGADASLSPLARTTGPIAAANDIYDNLGALDDAIGVDMTGVEARTNNPCIVANAVIANIEALDDAIGADWVPIVRTNNPTLVADTIGGNIAYLDSAIGADADLTIIARTTGPLVVDSTIMAKFDALDLYLGDDVTPTVRTAGPLVAANDIGANLEALDAAIGIDATITAVVRTTGLVVATADVFTNLDALDAAIGADSVPTVRTVGPTVAANATNANIDALDTAIGTDAQLASLGFVAVANSVMQNLSAIDAELVLMKNKYTWVEDFDEEAAAVQFESGLRADEWVSAGTNYAAANLTYVQAPGGAVQAVTAGADNDSVHITGINTKIAIDSNPIFECRFKVTDITNVFICAGLVEGSFDDKGTYDDDIIVVGIDSDNGHTFGADQIVLVTNNNGAGASVEDMGLTITADTYITIRIDCTDIAQPRVYINATGGVITAANEISAGSITGTIQGSIYVSPYVMVQSLSAAADTLTVDYVKVWQDRG